MIEGCITSQCSLMIGSHPHNFRNVDTSEPVMITINAIAHNLAPVLLTLTGNQ